MYNIRNVEGTFLTSFSLIVLGFGSVLLGYFFKDLFIGVGTNYWENSIYIDNNISIFDYEYIPLYIKIIPLVLSFMGLLIGLIFLTVVDINGIIKYKSFFYFFNFKWYFDFFYNSFIAFPALSTGYYITFKFIDRGVFEFFGPTGLRYSVYNIANFFNLLYNGLVYHYAFIFFLTLIFFFFLPNYFYLIYFLFGLTTICIYSI